MRVLNAIQTNLLVIHPFCTHYTAGLFEELARRMKVQFYFFSDGGEWYWSQEHGIRRGEFAHEYLKGIRIAGGRITPSLPWKLLTRRANAVVSSIDGRFALPMAYVAARLSGSAFLLWTGMWSRIDTPLHRLLFSLTRYFYRHADAVIVYGEHVKRYLAGEGVRPDRIFVAPHSVDNTLYRRRVSSEEKRGLRQQIGLSDQQRVILFLGRLEEVKGIEYLIRAFADVSPKDVVLLIAGDGSQRAYLEALSQENCLAGKVVFTGYVPVENAVVFHSIAHVCVLPSVTTPAVKELWGLVVNEAFNQGVPVIATDAVGAAAGGLVQDGVNGLVVPERDSERLGQALAEILTDDELRERLGANAKAAIADWTHERMADAFEQAVEYALRGPRTAGNLSGCSERSVRCPLCDRTEGLKGRGVFRKCGHCGLVFRHPMPTLQDLDALYNRSWEAPAKNSNETGGTTVDLAEVYASQLTKSLGRCDLRGLRILEYGAGRGEFLRALERRGAQVFALEPYGKEYLQQQGFPSFRAIEDLPEGVLFDGIVTIDVVEHEFAAWGVLRRLRPLLVHNGWLYVATPNPAGLNAKLTGERWREAQKPGHLLFFPPRTLERVLAEAGFARPQRLRWNVPYGTSLVTRLKDLMLSTLGLDGELRYLAFRLDEK